jgi:hypothetical protein
MELKIPTFPTGEEADAVIELKIPPPPPPLPPPMVSFFSTIFF